MKKYFCCFLLILASCGGSGSGGRFEMESGDVVILPTYGFQISATPAAGPLTVTFPDEGDMRAISLDFGNTLNGEVNVSVDLSNNTAVTDFSVQMLSSVVVDTDVGASFLGAFTINITEDMLFAVGEPPTSGMFEVVTDTETVVLQPFIDGVQLRFGDGAPISLTWDELESFLDDELALDGHRRAALAVEVLEFVLVQFLNVAEALNFVDDQLATVNPLVASCDAFTGAPPVNVLAQGESTFTWIGLGSIPLGGDDFHWAFTDCWIDDANGTEDQLINGSIDLNTYIEVTDAQNNLIDTGFDEVIFNSLTIASTEENQQGVFTIDPKDTITVSGGFDLAFVGFTN